jgi:hypothetical protein
MTKQFVRVVTDVYCECQDENPVYRVYVNGELFGERKWRCPDDQYLEEIIQIEAEPGDYVIRYELIRPSLASLKIENYRVVRGPGRITNNRLRIYNNKFSILGKTQ